MQGVSLTHPVLAFFFFFLSGEFLLRIMRWLYFSMGSFSYTSHACLIFLWGVSLTHPMLAFFLGGGGGVSLTHPVLACFFFIWEFLLHIPRWLYFSVGSFSYTSHACSMFLWAFFSFFLFFFFFFLLLFSFFFNLGSFSYTSRASFIFMRQVYLTHPVLALFLCGSFSYTSQACFLFLLGVCLTHPEFFVLSLSLLRWLHFYAGCFSYTSRAGFFFFIFFYLGVYYTSGAGFIFLWGVSLTHPMLVLFLCGEFLLHIPCWLLLLLLLLLFFCLNLWNFSYTSRAGFIFMRGVSLTNPVLALFLSGEFLLHIPCLLFISVGSLSYTSLVGFSPSLLSWLHFYAGSFSYTSRAGFFFFFFFFLFYLGSFFYTSPAGFIFRWGVSLTHPMLVWFFCGEFLLQIPCWLHIYAGSFS